MNHGAQGWARRESSGNRCCGGDFQGTVAVRPSLCEWGAAGRWALMLGRGAQKKPSVLMTLTKHSPAARGSQGPEAPQGKWLSDWVFLQT